MPMDADDEFEFFYDYRRAYTHLNIKRKSKVLAIAQNDDPFQTAEDDHDMAEERKAFIAAKKEKKAKKVNHVDSDGFESDSDAADEDVEEVSEDDWDDLDVEDDDKAADNDDDMPELLDAISGKNSDTLKSETKSASIGVHDSQSSIKDVTESSSGFSQLSTIMKGE